MPIEVDGRRTRPIFGWILAGRAAIKGDRRPDGRVGEDFYLKKRIFMTK